MLPCACLARLADSQKKKKMEESENKRECITNVTCCARTFEIVMTDNFSKDFLLFCEIGRIAV